MSAAPICPLTAVPPGPRDEAAAHEFAAALTRGGAVLLTGAGLSTESGIPDYRGADGRRRVTPMQYGEFVATSAARQRYWARSFIGWRRFRRAVPNAGHEAVTHLERAGLLSAVITQNVDGLHQDAGTRSVIELHGTLEQVVCLTCGERCRRADVDVQMRRDNPGFEARATGHDPDGSRVSSQIRPDGDIVLAEHVVREFVVPTCPGCGQDTLKPDVVFFGESVPAARVEECFRLVSEAETLVVLGSSLAVMSGFRFVRRAARDGIPVLIATASPTRGDELAQARTHEALGTLLPRVVELVHARTLG